MLQQKTIFQKGDVLKTPDFNIKKTRQNLVQKDNTLIQRGRSSLSLIENKALLYTLSLIKPGDSPDTVYSFNIEEFKMLIKWDRRVSYGKIRDLLANLSAMTWIIDITDKSKENKKESIVHWFNIMHLTDENTVDITFHPDIFPYLVRFRRDLAGVPEDSKGYYTSYKLQNITLMKCKYSQKLYELLKSYSNNNKWTFECGTGSSLDLQRRIADYDSKTHDALIPASWKNWAEFKRAVLEKAKKEINMLTDLTIDYTGIKVNSRSVNRIEFAISLKTDGQQIETNAVIDASYKEIDEANEKNHKPVNDLIKSQEMIAEMEEEKKEADILLSSKHPSLKNLLGNEFSDEQVDVFYYAALNGAGGINVNVDADMHENYVTDLVAYYFNKIKLTPQKTKGTKAERLYNLVFNDYDNIGESLKRKYSF